MTETLTRLLPHLGELAPEANAHLARINPLEHAGRAEASKDTLEELSRHPNYRVRMAVALNPSTGGEIKERLTSDKSALVRQAAQGTLTDKQALSKAGPSGVLAALRPGHPYHLHSTLDEAIRAYGEYSVEEALLANSLTWEEAVDHVVHGGDRHYRDHEGIAHYCRSHEDTLRTMRGALNPGGKPGPASWASRQVEAALAATSAQLDAYLADPDTDVIGQALHNPACTLKQFETTVNDPRHHDALEEMAMLSALRTHLRASGEDALTASIERAKNPRLVAGVLDWGFPDPIKASAVRAALHSSNPDMQAIAAASEHLERPELTMLVERGSVEVLRAVSYRGDDGGLDEDIAIAILSHENAYAVGLHLAAVVPDESLGRIPWKALQRARATDSYTHPAATGKGFEEEHERQRERLLRYTAERLHALANPQAIETIAALDKDFTGTIDEMLAACAL